MADLRPVDLVTEGYLGQGDGFITTPDMYDEKRGEPGYTIHEAARFFFGRSRSWLQQHVWLDHVYLDGQPVQIPRDPRNNYLRFRLYDVERVAWALAQTGHLQVAHLQRVIAIIKLVAQNYKYLDTEPPPTRVSSDRD